MKRILAAVLCSVMILAGCGSSSSAPAEETAGIYTPGTYTSTASGNNGDVTLKVTFSADKIESIEVESAETPTIGVRQWMSSPIRCLRTRPFRPM